MGQTVAHCALVAAALATLLGLGAALEIDRNIKDEPIQHGLSGNDLAPGSGSGQAAAAAAAKPPPDDSVRCRLSGICDSPAHTCNGTDVDGEGGWYDGDATLACTTSDDARAAAVQAAARYAWTGYRDCAWGEDELRPLSCSGVHWLNLSLTMVDSLDTLYLLGLRREFEEAAEWLTDHLNVGAPAEVNLFETTIRVLGGLLSAQALSADTHPPLARRLAEKAAELGARLMPAFTSPSGLPYSDVNLRTGVASPPLWGHVSSLAEMCSVSLEFTYLSRLTGHAPFEEVPLKVHDLLEAHAAAGGGLLGQYFDPLTGRVHREHSTTITLGARSDSTYEYMLKQWLLTGKTDDWLRERYVRAMRSVRSRLLRRTASAGQPGLWYVAEQSADGKLSGKMDHLVCFLPGLLALGDLHNVSTRHDASSSDGSTSSSSRGGPSSRSCSAALDTAGQAAPATCGAAAGQEAGHAELGPEDMSDLAVAHELAQSCYELYRRTPAGLAPEIAIFANNTESPDFPNRHVHDVGHGDFSIKQNDAHSLLRPEAVESFFLLWKVTGNPLYKQWAWQVFRALEKWARVRPQDRHESCATCLAEAAVQAAQHAQASSATAPGQNGADAAVAAAAAELARRQLRGEELCAACSTTGGYSSLDSVLAVPPPRRDKMESFFVAETLKYLYLTFTEPPDRCLHASCQGAAAAVAAAAAGGAPDGAADYTVSQGQQQQQQQQQQQRGRPRLPLDRFVFTTEAHALPIVGPSTDSAVAPVIDPDSPLLRPFEGGQSGMGGAEAAATQAAATAAAQQKRRAAQIAAAVRAAAEARRRFHGSAEVAADTGLLEGALQQIMEQLASAAAALSGQPSLLDAAGSPAATAMHAAAAKAAAEESEEGDDPYEDEEAEEEEEDDPYEDPLEESR